MSADFPRVLDRERCSFHDVSNNARLVETNAGGVLVYSPPEILKNLWSKGLEVPQIVLLPPDINPNKERGSCGFIRKGINYASVEFLLYFNFFVKGGLKTKLITVTDDQSYRLKRILEEAIVGPYQYLEDGSYSWLERECKRVSHTPLLDSYPSVNDIAEIYSLESDGGELGSGAQIRIQGDRFIFGENGHDFLSLPTSIMNTPAPLNMAPPYPRSRQRINLQFLGSSNGFDPQGITTCFLAYLGESGQDRPVLFEAAAYLRDRLGNLGISLHQISEVVLTHIHEDHMAGIPELLLMSDKRVRLITSDLVYESLLRMLSAMMNLPILDIDSLIDFYPLNPGEPLTIGGKRFEAIYSVHAIPTLAVKVNGLCYSGDMRYDEVWFDDLEREGIMSSQRKAELLNFASGEDVLVHDVGGGDIHTTLTPDVFLSLMAKSKHLILVHTSEKELPAEQSGRGNKAQFAYDGMVFSVD